MCVLCAHTRLCAEVDSALSVHTHSLSLCGPAEYLEGRGLCVCLRVSWGSLCPGRRQPDCGVSGVLKEGDDWDGGADPRWVQLRRNMVRGT